MLFTLYICKCKEIKSISAKRSCKSCHKRQQKLSENARLVSNGECTFGTPPKKQRMKHTYL
ncbi:hypothetical protein JCM6292_3525 [Bacteroides pyogenes JCM 6292]|uniref:Uncharacterized protein n=2 Tax=Bacteroides pyogenes TaxID=310300 RepID=W4PEU6_9BACE|nr:hypothetical protein JCM6292_3525 [Bacteroides pyogenes JCM 6292]GAE17699.1 hypothetical protein JCM6294_482 [Bacteroides pyogenes DSM 20611 = JCM 6294]